MPRSLLAILSPSARVSALSANASARQARTHCAARVRCRHVLLPVVLVVSEPVTNAVPADAEAGAVDDDIGVELVVGPVGRHIALAVTDSGDRPLPEAPGGIPSEDAGGRGLLLLDTLSYDHRWAPCICGGKRVGRCSAAPLRYSGGRSPFRSGWSAPMPDTGLRTTNATSPSGVRLSHTAAPRLGGDVAGYASAPQSAQRRPRFGRTLCPTGSRTAFRTSSDPSNCSAEVSASTPVSTGSACLCSAIAARNRASVGPW
ncbi:ATP-binding protein [Streptomyces sp. NPDC006270]|uniref:ATP-binding protein n=1 Tax=Streptomyces sp. NPDC006270 TaxID=3364741 RepID=UPI00368D6F2E